MKKAYFNWSSGKDSALALYKVLQSGRYDVQALFSIVKKDNSKIAMHEIGVELLKQQADSIGIPLTVLEFDLTTPSDNYKKSMEMYIERFKKREINIALFGDLYLENLRNQRTDNCRRHGIQAEFPLWNSNPKELLREFISLGFKSIVTCVDGSALDESFVGRVIDESFLNDFEIVRRYHKDYPNEANTMLNRYWYLELK